MAGALASGLFLLSESWAQRAQLDDATREAGGTPTRCWNSTAVSRRHVLPFNG